MDVAMRSSVVASFPALTFQEAMSYWVAMLKCLCISFSKVDDIGDPALVGVVREGTLK